MNGRGTAGGMLAGRVAVVLGATGWIGRAMSRTLIEKGADVVLVARNEDRLDALQRELGAGDRVLTAVADVTSLLEMDDARAAAIARFGHVDLVIVLSGVITGSAFEDGVPADWAEMIDVNLRGLLHTVQTFSDPLLASAAHGRPADLVLLGAASEDEHAPRFAVFNAISSATAQLARTLRHEYGPRGLRVHVLAPGFRQPAAPGESPVLDPRRDRDRSPLQPEAMAAVVALAAALPRGANLAEMVLLATDPVQP